MGGMIGGRFPLVPKLLVPKLLVPKLCLGTGIFETLFRLLLRTLAKRSFADLRSQTEFENESHISHTRGSGRIDST